MITNRGATSQTPPEQGHGARSEKISNDPAYLPAPCGKIYDRLLRLIARQLGVSGTLATVSSRDGRRFVAAFGLAPSEIQRYLAFCAHALLHRDVFESPDMRNDPTYQDHPLVNDASEGIRYFASAPLKATDGQNLGVLCLFNEKPRKPLSRKERSMLTELTAVLVEEFETQIEGSIFGAQPGTEAAAKHRLATTEKQLSLFIEHAPAAIAMFNRNMEYIAVSRRWCEDYGVDAEHLIGRSHYEVFPEIPDRWRRLHQKCLRGAVLKARDDEIRRVDGTLEWLNWEMHPWFEANGTVGGLILFTEVTTEKKQAMNQLESSQRFLEAVLENVQEGIYACDANGRLTIFNPAAKRIVASDIADIAPEEWGDYYRVYEADGVTPLTPEQVPLYRALHGETFRDQEVVIIPEGHTPRHVLISGQPLIVHDGTKIGAVVSVQDITERTEMESRYRQSQKMEAVGQLTGGMAHDFNNLLAVIIGNLQLLQRSFHDNDKAERRIVAALEAARRGADLTSRLLAFSRKQRLEVRKIYASSLIAGLKEMLERTLGEAIELETVLDEEPWPILVDDNRLEAAVLNLCLNARDAMPDGGKLIVETAKFRLGQREVPELPPGEYVTISVTDTGHGMPKSVRQKVFEPFFTTKEVGSGTGLGLSMVYGFVKQSGGAVRIYSEVDRGTTITMYFPRCSEEGMTDVTPEISDEDLKVGGGRILVVEDDDAVRDVALALLDDLGYETTAAENGEAALKILQSSEKDFDALLTDVVMPGKIDGPALARAVQEDYPTMQVVFMSGFAEGTALQNSGLEQTAILVGKPFHQVELARKLQQALRRRTH